MSGGYLSSLIKKAYVGRDFDSQKWLKCKVKNQRMLV